MNFVDIEPSNEIIDEDGDVVESPPEEISFDSVAEDMENYRAAHLIEKGIQAKVDAGVEMTDDELTVATETIFSLYRRSENGKFKSFGFEAYAGQTLTQAEKTQIALEAITNQNGAKAREIGAKFENLMNGIGNYASFFNGNMERLHSDAKSVLERVRNAEEADFEKQPIMDKRISQAVQRGGPAPFTNYKDVLRGINSLTDSLKVVANVSKYESIGSGEGSKWDLAQLAKDLGGRVVNRSSGTVTYDLNPERITGTVLRVKVPDNSDSGYVMRNLKANFVVSAEYNIWRNTDKGGQIKVKPLTQREAISLLEDVIKHIEKEQYMFQEYYKVAKVGLTDVLKIFGKAFVSSPLGVAPLVFYNSLIFRTRIQSLSTKLHYINQDALRGLIAWAASSLNH